MTLCRVAHDPTVSVEVLLPFYLTKTIEIYLPPITTKVTEFSTIQKYLSYLQNLCRSVNMPYVNITLDMGAAINAFKTVWSYPDEYCNVFKHLGCFHFIKENFQVYFFSKFLR